MQGNHFSIRRQKLAEQFGEQKIDAFFVTSAPNVRYLTGFTGSNGQLLVFPDEAYFFTDPRYRLQSAQQVNCKITIASGPLWPRILAVLNKRKVRQLGFESHHLNFWNYQLMRAGVSLKTELRSVTGLVERLRMTKSPEEIRLIRAAVATNSAAFELAVKAIRPGIREIELAAEIEYRMRGLGAEKAAFDTIVAFGERTALPHAQPGPTALKRGQLVLIDMGAMREGYSSDMTRMLHLGRAPRKLRQMYDAVLEAQLAAVAAVRPGVTAAHVDQMARKVLKSAGLDKLFVHSTGHGLGLEIHEPPRVGRKDMTRLGPGMAITIEPGVYLSGFGGIRIEDTLVVTETGCEVLTQTPKLMREI